MKRRTFLQSTFLTYLALNLPVNSELFAASTVRSSLIYATQIKKQFFINSFNTKTSKQIKIPIPFRVHSVTDLGNERVLLIEKKGTGCCVVDFNSQKITRILKEEAANVFYGHAEIDFKNKKIYFPQRVEGKNHIFIRSLDTFEKISGSIYQTDKEIHMISMLEDQRLAICLDNKDAPAIDILNLENKFTRTILIENSYFRPGHICHISDGDMYVTGVIGSGYQSGAVLNYHYKDLTYLDKEVIKKLTPIFWLRYHPGSRIVCGVSPYSGEVLLISHDSKKILKQLSIPDPYGVDLAGDNFMIIGPKGLTYINSSSFKVEKPIGYPEMQYILDDFHPILV